MQKFFALSSLIAPVLLSAQSYLDPSFGVGGYVTLDMEGSFEQFKELAVQPDGKILAAGHASFSFDTNPFIARFTADGVLDPSFNGTGWAIGPDTSWFDVGDYHAMVLQPDGKILCVGRARPTAPDYTQVLVVRYLTDGTLDPDFGNGGYVLHGSPANISSWKANDVALTPGGGIRICGAADENPNNDYEFLVLGLLPDGSLDPAFGSGGVVNFHPGDPSIDCNSFGIALQSDGRIVVSTEGQVDMVGYVTIWGFRLNTDGTLDTTFGDNGLVINYNEGASAHDVAIGPNDEVLLVGYGSIFGSYQDLVTMQLDADGNNPVETVYECDDDESLMGHGAWMQDDGKAIALGLNGEDAYILRRLPDGSLDPAFGSGGIVSETTIEIDYGGDAHAGGFWIEDDGRMLVCGRSGVVPGNGDDAIIMAFYPYATAISELPALMSLSIAPNPASDGLTLTVDKELIGQEAVMELFNARGATVHMYVVPALAAHTMIALPPALPEGAYMLMMRTAKQQPRTSRVIIAH